MNLTTEFDQHLPESAQALLRTAHEFGQRHLQQDTADLSDSVRRDLLRLAIRAGLASMEVPIEHGGPGLTFATRMRVCETLANFDGAFAFSLVNHHNIMSRIARLGTEALRADVLRAMLAGDQIGCTAMTEPQSGSDFANMQTMATRTSDGWLLTGEKAWITNAALADVLLVYAQTDPTQGIGGIAGFVVKATTPGFERLPAYDAKFTRGTEVGGFALKDCFVADSHVLYPAPQGFKAAMSGVNQARIHVAALNTGLVDSALQTALNYARERNAFGVDLLSHQGIGWSLADVATQLQAMRLLLYQATRAVESSQSSSEDVQMVAAMAKKFSNDHALQAIAQCMQAMGAEGLRDRYVLARHLACARALCYTDGTPEMMNERIRVLLRKSS
ncbi:acyl-CoA dehydrogenase family protein [Orrella sp. 11846]|uniref:acyl-CoA dehydrogenase family protein n=1 Tax=Orrella sp. 11846 TaxID=3409913 RepID=UPI003B5A2E8C